MHGIADVFGVTSAQFDMSMDHVILQSVGVLGSLTYICVFFLAPSGRLFGNGVSNPRCQLLAALCVADSLATVFNLAAFVIQISFITIALCRVWFPRSGRISAQRDRSGAARSQQAPAPAEPTEPVRGAFWPALALTSDMEANKAA